MQYYFSTGSMPESLELWRRRHLELCRLTGMIDDMFNMNILLIFLIAIPCSSMILCNIILTMAWHTEQHGSYAALVTLGMALFQELGVMFIITYCGTTIHTAVSLYFPFSWKICPKTCLNGFKKANFHY